MTEQEQNKKINEHQRLINDLRERLKTVELDLEPQGRISNAFDAIEEHLEEHDKRFDRIDKRLNTLDHKSCLIGQSKINDLPEQ
jgi:ABC-type Fe3+-citrate transport system substrate-binding protein